MYGRHVQKSALHGSSIFCCGTGYAWCCWISCELFMMTSKYPCVKDVIVLIYFVPTPTLAIELFVSISTEHCPPPLTWNCKVWISWNTMWCIISDGKRNNRCHQNPNMHEERYFTYDTMAKKLCIDPNSNHYGPSLDLEWHLEEALMAPSHVFLWIWVWFGPWDRFCVGSIRWGQPFDYCGMILTKRVIFGTLQTWNGTLKWT